MKLGGTDITHISLKLISSVKIREGYIYTNNFIFNYQQLRRQLIILLFFILKFHKCEGEAE